MKGYFTFVFLLLLTVHATAQYVGLSPQNIIALKQLEQKDEAVKNMLAGLRSTADEALTESPSPRDTIVSEGHLNNHPDKIASIKAMQDYHKIYSLAIVYKLTNDEKFLQKAIIFLKAWAAINQPQGNPINDSKLDEVFAAYDMLRMEITTSDRNIIDSWLQTTASMEISKAKKGKSTTINNWQSHRLKVVGEVGFILNDSVFKNYAVEGLKNQVAINLNADGSSWDFKERDALHYHAYDLEPMLVLAIIIKRATNNDLFNYQSASGSSIKKSVDWFVPFITGQKTHAEFTNSKVAFDMARAKNNEKGYAPGTFFDPENGIYTLSLSAFFDNEYQKIIIGLNTKIRSTDQWQLLLSKLQK